MYSFLVFTLLAASTVFLCEKTAVAQDVVPSIFVRPDMAQETPAPMPELDMEFIDWGNDYFNDVMMLQYQVGLLQQMIGWQSEVNRMSQTYGKLGVPFTPPKPPQRACELLPYNILCFYSYPDLDLGMAGVEDSSFPLPRQQQGGLVGTLAKLAGGFMGGAQKKEDYQWANVSCSSGICKAVLTSPADKSYRRTVFENDKLENGAVVTAISVDGVTIKKEDKVIDLAASTVAMLPTQKIKREKSFDKSKLYNDNFTAPISESEQIAEEVELLQEAGKDVISHSKSNQQNGEVQEEIYDYDDLLGDMPDF